MGKYMVKVRPGAMSPEILGGQVLAFFLKLLRTFECQSL